jgi:hypothetical protein
MSDLFLAQHDVQHAVLAVDMPDLLGSAVTAAQASTTSIAHVTDNYPPPPKVALMAALQYSDLTGDNLPNPPKPK